LHQQWRQSLVLTIHKNFRCDHSGGAVWGMYCLHPLEHWDRGLECNLWHAFILCLCCIVCR
jgi:hypothetical protein